MAIEKLDYAAAVIEALQGAYRQDWCLTNWTGTGKPLLPAGMIISILGYPYLVSGGDETPADPASDGAVYLKVTPDAPAGATATAEYVNTFSGTWSESYNGFYDGDSLFLNVFMTKTGANWTAKGIWLNLRERKLALISDGLTVEGGLAVEGESNLTGGIGGRLLVNNLITVVAGGNSVLKFRPRVIPINSGSTYSVRMHVSGTVRLLVVFSSGGGANTFIRFKRNSTVLNTITSPSPGTHYYDMTVSEGDVIELEFDTGAEANITEWGLYTDTATDKNIIGLIAQISTL